MIAKNTSGGTTSSRVSALPRARNPHRIETTAVAWLAIAQPAASAPLGSAMFPGTASRTPVATNADSPTTRTAPTFLRDADSELAMAGRV
jgi:hypothetical protein